MYHIFLQFPPLNFFKIGCAVKKKKNEGILWKLRFVWEKEVCKIFKTSHLNCLTLSTHICLTWAASHGSFSKCTETDLYSFLLHSANENTALVLLVKWNVGTQGAIGGGFYKAMACLIHSGERSTGYPTTALLILYLFPSYSVQAALHKPVWNCRQEKLC